MSEEVTWVPDNLTALFKQLDDTPAVYGLPLFHLFYSKPHIDHDGISNRLSDSNKYVHAFRIIVGTTWNWAIANLSGLNISKSDLNKSITAKCCLCAGIKSSNKETWKWNKILNIDDDSIPFLNICRMRNTILCIYDIENPNGPLALSVALKRFFEDNLAKYAIQKEALVTLVPLDIQAKTDMKEFINENQKVFKIRYDLTKDIVSWAIAEGEKAIREKSWLSVKQIQRLLRKTGTNSKRKFARIANPPETVKTTPETVPSKGVAEAGQFGIIITKIK